MIKKRKPHNKRRNSALLYEFLVRHISKCLIEGRNDEAQKAVDISKKYFCEGSPLRKELALFGAIFESTVRSKESASKILEAVCKNASAMNVRNLDKCKSKLIKEINYTLKDPSFYDYKIPNYVTYASVQILLNEARNKRKALDIVSKVKLEESVVNYLTREPQKKDDPLKINPSYNETVYKFFLQRFHRKYQGRLAENQRKLLMKYASSLISSDSTKLREYMVNEVATLRSKLVGVKDETLTEDRDIMNKLASCARQLDGLDLKGEITEKHVLEVLQYQHLVAEVES